MYRENTAVCNFAACVVGHVCGVLVDRFQKVIDGTLNCSYVTQWYHVDTFRWRFPSNLRLASFTYCQIEYHVIASQLNKFKHLCIRWAFPVCFVCFVT